MGARGQLLRHRPSSRTTDVMSGDFPYIGFSGYMAATMVILSIAMVRSAPKIMPEVQVGLDKAIICVRKQANNVTEKGSDVKIWVRYVQKNKCKLFWTKEGQVGVEGSAFYGAAIGNMVFVPLSRTTCTWHLIEYHSQDKFECTIVNPVRDKCGEVQGRVPAMVPEGAVKVPVEIAFVQINSTIGVSLYIKNKRIHKDIPCIQVSNLPQPNWEKNAYCKHIAEVYEWKCNGEFDVSVMPEDTGSWAIVGPHGLMWDQAVEVLGKPEVHYVGPVVVGRQLRKRMLVAPQYSLVHLSMDMEVQIDNIVPVCAPYTRTIKAGWEAWVQSIEEPKIRQRRSIIGAIIGGVGAGLGVVNTINQEVLTEKLGAIGTELRDLNHPLRTSLNSLSALQHKVTTILPEWFDTTNRDFKEMIKAIGTLQGNLSMAIACGQAQAWAQTIAQNIIRDGLNGILAPELKNIIIEKGVSEFEKAHQDWWKLVHFEVKLADQVFVFVLTIKQAIETWVYPVIPLGVLINNTLLWPEELPKWVTLHEENWQAINIQACVGEKGLGYACTSEFEEPDYLCFNNASGKCHHKIKPAPSKSMVVSINTSCVCVRTMCPLLLVNNLYNVTTKSGYNLCLCNVHMIKGCDVYFKQPTMQTYQIHAHYRLYKEIVPVQLGVDINKLQQLIDHPQLRTHLKALQEEGREVDITVHHSTHQIEQILERVYRTSARSWWSSFLYPGAGMVATWRLIFNPVIILLIIQIIVFYCLYRIHVNNKKLGAKVVKKSELPEEEKKEPPANFGWTQTINSIKDDGDETTQWIQPIKEGNL